MAYPAFTSQSKGPDSSYDSSSWDSGAYLLEKDDEWFQSPNLIPTNAAQSYGMTLSAVDEKSGATVLGVLAGGKKHAYNSTLGPVSAVGVLFTYKHGASGLFGHGKGVAGGATPGLSSRVVTLSCVHAAGTAHAANNENAGTPQSTLIATTISGAFSAAVIYSDRTTVNYNVTAYESAKPANGGAAAPKAQTIAPYSTKDKDGGVDQVDSVGPNIRRLVNSGYL